MGWGVASIGLALWSVIWATTVQTQVPAELLNRVYAYDVAGSLLSMALGRSLAGPLSTWSDKPRSWSSRPSSAYCAAPSC